MKTLEWRNLSLFGVFVASFEQISHIVLVFSSLTLNKQMAAGAMTRISIWMVFKTLDQTS